MITKKTYIPGKPRNKKLSAATSGTASVGKTEFNQVAGESHNHPNKGILDQITEAMLVAALRDIIISTDTETELTDENYLSSLRTIKEITERSISKITEDEAREVITFLKGIISGGTSHFVNLIASNKITSKDVDVSETITAKDIISDTLQTEIFYSLVMAELQDAILKGQLNSETFVSGFLGSGFRLNKIGEDWVLELDRIIVRKTMEVYELIVQRIRYQGGQVLHSPAGGKITDVTDGGTYWRCEHDSPDDFITDDQVLCQNFKVGSRKENPDGSTTFQGARVKRYWRRVTSYGAGWFNLSKTDMEAGSDIPEIDDEVAVLGNRTVADRQNAILIASTGGSTPYIAHYAGINSYSTAGKEVVREGNLSGIVDPDFGQLSGYGLYSQNVFLKGIFRLMSGKTVQEYVGDEIGNIQIGGRNLIVGTNTFSGYSAYLGSTVVRTSNYAVPEWAATDATRFQVSGGSNVIKLLKNFLQASQRPAGATYTLSIYVKNLGSTDVGVFTNIGSIPTQTVTPGQAVRLVFSPWSNNVATLQFQFRGIDASTGFDIALWHDQVEEGNKVSAWSENVEDISTEINRVETETKTRFNINETNIQANVTAITNVSGRVSVAESQLTIQAGQIATKVSQTAYDANNVAISGQFSSINQKADNISIKVDEVKNIVNLLDNPNNFSASNPIFEGSTLNYVEINGIYWKIGLGELRLKIPSGIATGEKFTVSFIAGRLQGAGASSVTVSHGSQYKDTACPTDVPVTVVFSFTKLSSSSYVSIMRTGGTVGQNSHFHLTNFQITRGEASSSKLLATGIDIDIRKITLTSNNTIFQNNSGQQVALFNSNWTKIQAAAIELEGLVTVNSKFKVLLDGSIEAVDGEFTGKITATSGAIGGFNIGASYIGAGSSWNGSANGMSLWEDFIVFNKPNRQALIGATSSLGFEFLGRFSDTGSSIYDKTGVIFNITGSSGNNTAISLVGGHIAGLAVRTRQIASGITLTRADVVVTCYFSNDSQNVYMPSSPEVGELKIIFNVNARSINMRGNGKSFKQGNGGPVWANFSFGPSHVITNSCMFVWDGQYWVILSI